MSDRLRRCTFCFEFFFVFGMPLLILGQGCLMTAEVKVYVKEGSEMRRQR